jgi:flavin-dependent dehydrogenase
MVGDASGFLDPVFSSGVFLAMKSAELATDVVDGALRSRGQEAHLQAKYRRTMHEAMDCFEWFIERFNSDAMDLLIQQPNNRGQVVQAIISMLSGDVIETPDVHRRLLAFKVIYEFTRFDAVRIQLADALLGNKRWDELTRQGRPRTFAP